ncbi:hypothetical protein ACLBWZ_12835 [Brucellaceae bacterium C25G]
MSDEQKTRTSKGMDEHHCMHKECMKWGSFGFKGRYGQLWFCREHKEEGEKEV